MEFNIENLKMRSQQVADETRKGANTSKRIGTIFYDIVCELENIYRKINRRTFIMSFLSVVLSITSIILSVFKSDDINVDGANLLGVMVGVLSFIVTLILGYQIYKTIEVEDIIDRKMSAIENRMHESIKTLVEVKVEERMGKGNSGPNTAQ